MARVAEKKRRHRNESDRKLYCLFAVYIKQINMLSHANALYFNFIVFFFCEVAFIVGGFTATFVSAHFVFFVCVPFSVFTCFAFSIANTADPQSEM